jgi:hypothetical protein
MPNRDQMLRKPNSYEDCHQVEVGWVFLSLPDQCKCNGHISEHAQNHDPLVSDDEHLDSGTEHDEGADESGHGQLDGQDAVDFSEKGQANRYGRPQNRLAFVLALEEQGTRGAGIPELVLIHVHSVCLVGFVSFL